MFTSYSYLTLLCNPLIGLFQCIPGVLAALACSERIQAFLEADARDDFRGHIDHAPHLPEKVSENTSGHAPKDHLISVSRGTFGWINESKSLQNIDLVIPAGKLTMVIGPIASGKSTLCKVLLGEVPIFDGKVTLRSPSRRIGYCDQSTFLFNATIKQNIVGFSCYDQARYNEVIEATMLTADLLALPQGDNTKVGSNGISLSGGQKQRVSTARALYLETDFLIFDDVLSGLDADTEEQVFQRVFTTDGIIKKRKATAVLCTHSIRHLPSADHIIALSPDGQIVEQGSFNDLIANEKYVHKLGVKVKDAEHEPLASNANIEKSADDPATNPLALAKTVTASLTSFVERDSSRTNRDISVYKYYYRSIGFWPVLFFVLTALAQGFFFNWQTIWIDFWSNGVMKSPPVHSNGYYLGLFAFFQLLGLLLLFQNVWICFQWIISASGASLHKAALETVINAPLRFFTTTDNGVVTNLFSQDMTLIDGELPIGLINVFLCGAQSIGMAAVVAASAPYLSITYPFLVALLWVLQKFYLRTSKQLRLLDLEAKSPL